MEPKNKKKSTTPPHGTPVVEPNTLVTKQETSLAAYDYGEMAGWGMSTIDRSILSIPFIWLLQAKTPGVEKRDSPIFAKAGDFWDKQTGILYKGDVGFTGVHIVGKKEYLHKDSERNKRKYLGKYGPNDPFVLEAKAYTADLNKKAKGTVGFGKIYVNGTSKEDAEQLIETHSYLSVLRYNGPEGGMVSGVISYKSTGIPVVGGWLSGVNRNVLLPDGRFISEVVGPLGLPLLANQFVLTSEYKEEGNTWYQHHLRPAHPEGPAKSILSADDMMYKIAVDLALKFKRGEAKVDESTQDVGEGDPDPERGGGRSGGHSVTPEEIPF